MSTGFERQCNVMGRLNAAAASSIFRRPLSELYGLVFRFFPNKFPTLFRMKPKYAQPWSLIKPRAFTIKTEKRPHIYE